MFLFKKLIAGMLMLAAVGSAALAEVPAPSATPEPVNFLEITPPPTPVPEPTAAIRATEVVESGLEDDGLLRVRLASLGAPEELNLHFAGDYAVEGDPGFRFGKDARLTAFVHDGSVWFSVGGLKVDMGESVTLTRHCEEGLFIEESEKDAAYIGDLTLSASGNALRPVLTIAMEEYLYGVVAYEMSDSFPIEALKAQAVAARTYALQRKYAAGGRDHDVVDTTADQVYKGFDGSYTNVIAAVDATRGVVGTYKGNLAACYYTASNGGQIACPNDIWGGDGDDDYIEMRDDPFDLENPRSLVNSLSFKKDLSDNAKLKKLLAKGMEKDAELVSVAAVVPEKPAAEGSRMYTELRFELNVRREVPVVTPTPEASASPKPFFTLTLENLLGTPEPETQWEEYTESVTLSVYEDVKDGFSLGLNGRDYEMVSVSEDEESFTIEMRRFGHGVGMSQRGAQWMAGEYDYSWQEILNFYYPGMGLEKIDWPEREWKELENLPTVYGYKRPEPTPRPTPAPLPKLEDGEYYAKVKLENESSTLNVREQPNTGAKVLDRFEHGRKIIVCSEPDENGWVKIRTAELTGYIMIDYTG